MRVREVDLGATYDLRRRVLRADTPSQDVAMAGDDVAGTFHLGVDDGDELVAVATFVPTADGVQLRGMAVEPGREGGGIGRLLLDAAVRRLRAAGVARLWCNARDPAIPFYERLGWRVTGDGFMDAGTGIPHHRMDLNL
jgi:phosphoribosylformimino-5-aminoimidazole carboxamide ribotide isomerase